MRVCSCSWHRAARGWWTCPSGGAAERREKKGKDDDGAGSPPRTVPSLETSKFQTRGGTSANRWESVILPGEEASQKAPPVGTLAMHYRCGNSPLFCTCVCCVYSGNLLCMIIVFFMLLMASRSARATRRKPSGTWRKESEVNAVASGVIYIHFRYYLITHCVTCAFARVGQRRSFYCPAAVRTIRPSRLAERLLPHSQREPVCGVRESRVLHQVSCLVLVWNE